MDLIYLLIILLLVITIIILVVSRRSSNDMKKISDLLRETKNEMDKSIGNKITESVTLQQNQCTLLHFWN